MRKLILLALIVVTAINLMVLFVAISDNMYAELYLYVIQTLSCLTMAYFDYYLIKNYKNELN